LPVNKANAVKSGIIPAKDAAKAVDYITIIIKEETCLRQIIC
jgi:hypothetical protein